MSLITPNNGSQSVGSTRVDSLNSKARFNENGQTDDEFSRAHAHRLSTFQVANTGAGVKGSADQPTTQNDDHEHPCVCDLKLPRKPLTSEERYAKAMDYLRNESKTDANSPRMVKSLHASPNVSHKKSSKMSSDSDASIKSAKSKSASSKKITKKTNKSKDGKSDEKTNKTKKKVASPDYEYQMLSEGAKTEGKKTKSVGKKGEKSGQKSKANSSRSKLTGEGSSSAVGSSSAKSIEEGDSSPRKNIRWKRKPQIAVRMNRTANLRLEKGQLYCGGALARFKGMSKVDEYFAKRAKRLAEARAKAKAEAEAARLRKAGGADGGVGGIGSTSEEDELASQKCEYMRCCRYAKK